MTLTIDQCADAAIAQAEAAEAYAEARRDYHADASEKNFLAMGDAHRRYVQACRATEEAVRAHKAHEAARAAALDATLTYSHAAQLGQGGEA